MLLLLTLLWSGCDTRYQAVSETVSEQDTLLAKIERELEQKRARIEQLEAFRKRQLPRNFSEKIEEYLPSIRKYAKWYGLDWRLIVAQILKESHFKENARSHVGAKGLMQIMPGTAQEIRRELDIEYIMKDPRENITAGVYHMYKQLKYFPEADPDNRLKLALAAYNCGPARVFDAQDIARYKRLDPYTWEAIRECLPLLTADNWRLHLEVWEQGVPDFGFFYGYGQTIDYVDDIWEKYALLQQMYKPDLAAISMDPATTLSLVNP